MCRSKDCGGRRCKGSPGSYAARLERQRRYLAAKRAAQRAAAGGDGGSGGNPGDPYSIARSGVQDAWAKVLQPGCDVDGAHAAYSAAVIAAGAAIAARVDEQLPPPGPGASREQQAEYLKARAESYQRELSAIRSFGGEQLGTAKRSVKAGVELAREQAKHFPDEWVELSNSCPPYSQLRIKGGTSRAHYCGKKAVKARGVLYTVKQETGEKFLEGLEYTFEDKHRGYGVFFVKKSDELLKRVKEEKYRTYAVEDDAEREGYMRFGGAGMVRTGYEAEITSSVGRPSTMLHELSHRMEEHNPQISTATKAFLAKRCEGKPYRSYLGSSRETYRDGGFADVYMGKDYPRSPHTELFSCGMEAVFHGRYGGFEGFGGVAVDREHRNLVLGLLAFAGTGKGT
jgi:hypothetical protein